MSRLGPVLHRLRAYAAAPSAQSVGKLSLRLSIVAIAGVVALVLIWTQPHLPGPSATCTSRSYGRSLLLLPPRDRPTSHPDRPTDLFLASPVTSGWVAALACANDVPRPHNSLISSKLRMWVPQLFVGAAVSHLRTLAIPDARSLQADCGACASGNQRHPNQHGATNVAFRPTLRIKTHVKIRRWRCAETTPNAEYNKRIGH